MLLLMKSIKYCETFTNIVSEIRQHAIPTISLSISASNSLFPFPLESQISSTVFKGIEEPKSDCDQRFHIEGTKPNYGKKIEFVDESKIVHREEIAEISTRNSPNE
jgi:hypothetical protein